MHVVDTPTASAWWRGQRCRLPSCCLPAHLPRCSAHSQVTTPSVERRLAARDVITFRNLMTECCDLDDYFVSRPCQVLQRATNDSR